MKLRVSLNKAWNSWEARDENDHLVYRHMSRKGSIKDWMDVLALSLRMESIEGLGW